MPSAIYDDSNKSLIMSSESCSDLANRDADVLSAE